MSFDIAQNANEITLPGNARQEAFKARLAQLAEAAGLIMSGDLMSGLFDMNGMYQK